MNAHINLLICHYLINLPLLYSLLIALGAYSDDDDEVKPTVMISDGESSYVELNECDIGGGPMATEFFLHWILNLLQA